MIRDRFKTEPQRGLNRSLDSRNRKTFHRLRLQLEKYKCKICLNKYLLALDNIATCIYHKQDKNHPTSHEIR